MGITDFITWIKRESRYGGSPVITGAAAAADLPTIDILTSLNARRKRIWRKPGNWPWFIEQISFPVVPGTVTYSVNTVSGNKIDRIQSLIPIPTSANPPVLGDPLDQKTERQFAKATRDYYSNPPNGVPGQPAYTAPPTIYKNLGQTNGIWKVQLWPSPSSPFTMGGSAKGLLNTFLIGDVTGVAPFSAGNVAGIANAPLDYFPDGVIEDILFEGVMADVQKILGNLPAGAAGDQSFEGKVKLLAAEEANAAVDDTPITRPLPSMVLRRMNRRRWR